MWKDKYKVGVPLIDEQHQELFRRVEEFIVALRSDNPWEEKLDKVRETLDFMKVYVVEHFRAEEEYQAQVQYPGLRDHSKIHSDFAGEVVEFEQQFAQLGYEEELVQKFAGKLLTWLINHVATQDQAIGHWARQGGGAL